MPSVLKQYGFVYKLTSFDPDSPHQGTITRCITDNIMLRTAKAMPCYTILNYTMQYHAMNSAKPNRLFGRGM